MTRTLRLQTRVLLFAGLLPLALAGCPWNQGPGDTPDNAKLVAFESQADLLNYFKEQARQRTRQRSSGLFRFGGMAAPTAAEETADTGGADTSGTEGAAEESFSTTNIQEAGVDESDVVKSDGTHFYVADGDTLRIVQADPLSALAEVGRLDLDVYASGLYLYGSKLIVLAQRYEEYDGGWGRPEIEIWPPYYVGAGLTVLEIDVSDPAAPELTKQIELDGALADSRLTNGRLILVLTIAPELPEDPTPLAISAMTLDQVLPNVRVQSREREMVQWEQCLHPGNPDGYFMTAMVTLDAADIETIVHSVAVIAEAGTIYASTEALYATDSDYDASDNYREMTAIHKFGFDEDGAAQYVASGSVPGRLLNQFSLGEYEGYLRVATHVANPVFFGWGEDAIAVGVADSPQALTPPDEYNAVYVLAPNGAELETVGAVEDIAPGEDLHSARFIGTRGFLVTFRRIDPLLAIDLSDPSNPEVKGELKIPGYSDYLHPLDDNHLIGVGRTVLTMPSWGGEEPGACQLSLFDVSDLDNPTLVQQISLGGMHSWSYVTQTHKAFTLMPEQGLLAIPMRLTDESTSWIEYDLDAFYGVVCFQVDPESGFTELGSVEAVGAPETDYYETWYPYSSFWMRAAFIGDTVYAVDADGVRAAPLSDFSATSEIVFPE